MSIRINIVLLVVIALLAHVAPLQSQIVDQKLTLSQVEANWKTSGWSIPAGWSPVISESDAQSWAKQLNKAIDDKDVKIFTTELFDFNQLSNDSFEGIPDGKFKTGMEQGIKAAMVDNLKAMIASDFSVRRTRITKLGPTVLTRMLNGDGTVAYILWRLLKSDKGKVKAVDLLSLGTGEWTSHTLNRAAVINLPKEASFLQKLTGKQIALSKGQAKFQELARAQAAKDYKLVLKLYGQLTANMKSEKFIQMIRLNAAMQVDDDEYMKAIQELKRKYPDDMASLLHSIDFYFIKEDFGKMRSSIEAILEQVGPDSHLYNLKAVGYSSENKHTEAAKTLILAINTEPEREDNYWSLVETALNAKDFDMVTATLKSLVAKFNYEEFDFESVDIYKPFLGSPQHKEFVEFLKTRTK